MSVPLFDGHELHAGSPELLQDRLEERRTPGQAGEDPGAVHAATGLREADVALRIAHVLKAILDTHPEFEAALTRDTDRTVALKARTDLANARDAHLVSIHCNAAGEALAHYDRRAGEYVARRLWVLRKTRRPAVLVECAFISNPEEARLLGDDLNGFKERLAVAVFKGLRASLLGRRETKPTGKEVSA
jgi:N-acetylmuramoyl-L-alanine amidase